MGKIIGFILVFPAYLVLQIVNICLFVPVLVVAFPFFLGICLLKGESIIDFYKFAFSFNGIVFFWFDLFFKD
jgi:hypothetical protein